MTTKVLHSATAWELIGFDSRWPMNYDPYGDDPEPVTARVRMAGGRAGYDAVGIRDGGDAVYLWRLDAPCAHRFGRPLPERGLRVVKRYVPADALIEVMEAES